MRNLQTLDTEGFLGVLARLPDTVWTVSVEKGCLHLRRVGSTTIYSPLTAVYFHLTGDELHRGSFLHLEITDRFRLPWYDILEITYAEICCVCNGKHYSSKLRLCMLEAVAPLVRAENLQGYLEDLVRETSRSRKTL